MHHSTSNIGPYWRATGIQKRVESSCVEDNGADHLRFLVPQNRFYLQDSSPDEIDTSQIKAASKQSELPIPSFSHNVSSEFEV